MKKLLALVVSFAPLLAFGQLEKGMLLITGNISFQQNNFGEQVQSYGSAPEIKSIEFSPSVAYMLTQRFAVGIAGSYEKTDQKFNPLNGFSVNRTTIDTYSAGPFVRYYQPIVEKFYFFAQGDISYYKSEMTQYSGVDVTHTSFSTTRIAMRPGISYFVMKRLAIEIILGSISYNKTTFSGNGGDTDGFTFNFITRGVSPGVTFTF